ncbi:VanZ family protein [Saccharopolyspora halophila]|uniref:VanZ family protein n=1 Tax=Saccharopolyspora halophila TaxID=405551 RepID=UPI0031DEF52F
MAVIAGGVSAFARGYSTAPIGLREPFVDGALVYSVLCVGYLVFTPQFPPPDPVRPKLGNDVEAALTAIPGDSEPWIQLGGNLVLLLPLALLVPQRLDWFDNIGKIALGGLVTSTLIELVQFLAISGRVASTDDIVCNSLGAAVGGVLVQLPQRFSPGVRAQHRSTGENDRTVWLLIEKLEQERNARQRTRGLPRRRPSAGRCRSTATSSATGQRPSTSRPGCDGAPTGWPAPGPAEAVRGALPSRPSDRAEPATS